MNSPLSKDARTLVSNQFTKIDPDQPMNQTNLWLWLNQWTVASIPHRNTAEIVIAYLEEVCGYDYTRNVISSEDSESLRMVINHWYSVNPWFTPHSLNELVKLPSTVSTKPSARQLLTVGDATPTLLGLVRRAHWIYANDVNDDNTYFELRTDEAGKSRLYAIAQQILARRFLCEVQP